MSDTALAPDPSTNTAPSTGPQTLAPNNGEEFAFLDDMGTAPPAFPETWEEQEAITEGETSDAPSEAEAALPEPASTQAATGSEAATPEQPQVQQPEPDQQAQLERQAFQAFDKALREDPQGVAATILRNLDPRDRSAFLSQFTDDYAPIAPFDPEGVYEPQGELEEALIPRMGAIDSIPQVIRDLEEVKAQLPQAGAYLQPHVGEAKYAAFYALEAVRAVAEAIGMDMPEPNMEDLKKFLADGKTDYRTAIQKSTKFKDAVTTHKQKSAPRPSTPGSGTRRADDGLKEGASMLEIIRAMRGG